MASQWHPSGILLIKESMAGFVLVLILVFVLVLIFKFITTIMNIIINTNTSPIIRIHIIWMSLGCHWDDIGMPLELGWDTIGMPLGCRGGYDLIFVLILIFALI